MQVKLFKMMYQRVKNTNLRISFNKNAINVLEIFSHKKKIITNIKLHEIKSMYQHFTLGIVTII